MKNARARKAECDCDCDCDDDRVVEGCGSARTSAVFGVEELGMGGCDILGAMATDCDGGHAEMENACANVLCAAATPVGALRTESSCGCASEIVASWGRGCVRGVRSCGGSGGGRADAESAKESRRARGAQEWVVG